MLPLALAVTTASAAITCSSRGSASGRRRDRRPKPKPIAFPPAPVRRLVSSSLRRLLPRPRRKGRRKSPAEDAALLLLSLAFGDRLAALAEAWRASGLGQALGIWAAVCGRARRRRLSGLRRLATLLLGVAICALVSRLRGAALLEGLGRTGGARRLARIFLH